MMAIGCALSALLGGALVQAWHKHFVIPALVKAAMDHGARVNPPPSMQRRIARLEQCLNWRTPR